MEKYYADGYHLQLGLSDMDLRFVRRGEEQVVVTIPLVLAKMLARQLAEAVRWYEERLGQPLPTVLELEEKLRPPQGTNTVESSSTQKRSLGDNWSGHDL